MEDGPIDFIAEDHDGMLGGYVDNILEEGFLQYGTSGVVGITKIGESV